jgi:hypothetical protein
MIGAQLVTDPVKRTPFGAEGVRPARRGAAIYWIAFGQALIVTEAEID